MTEEEWVQLCQRRLHNILGAHTVANARTLENKIADAGPLNQRAEPHIISRARQALVEAGEIRRVDAGGATWFHLPSAAPGKLKSRLAELRAVHNRVQARNFTYRVGQALEIAVYRALQEQAEMPFFGHYPNLEAHDDKTLYTKEEPPSSIGRLAIPNQLRLDFLVPESPGGWVGLEVKNIREWLYQNSKEIRELLLKCCSLNAIPVLIARRIPYISFSLLSRCGVVLHQTYNQRFPLSEKELADLARDKRLLGYHDIKLGNEPDDRLRRFLHVNLPKVLPEARRRFDKHRDLLMAHATLEIPDEKFAAIVAKLPPVLKAGSR